MIEIRSMQLLSVILYLKGYQAIQVHLATFLWNDHRKELALVIQSRNTEVFSVDIHPACEIGSGIMSIMQPALSLVKRQLLSDNVHPPTSHSGGTGNKATAIPRFDPVY